MSRSVRCYGTTGPPRFSHSQLHSCNIADHSAYLNHVWCKFRSLYPHGHVTDILDVLGQLKSHPDFPKADQIHSGLKETFPKSQDYSYNWVDTSDVQAQYLMQVLQDTQGKEIMVNYHQYGGNKNISLHDLVGSLMIAQKSMMISVNVDGWNIFVKMDYGCCPFCQFTSWSHSALNNHVWKHLQLSLICGFKDCMFITMDGSEMLAHSVNEHHFPKVCQITPWSSGSATGAQKKKT